MTAACGGGCWMSRVGGACLGWLRWTFRICIGGSFCCCLVGDAGSGGAGRPSPVASGAVGGVAWWCASVEFVRGMAVVTGGLTGTRVERACGGGGTLWWPCLAGGAAWWMRSPFSSVYAFGVAMIGGACSGGSAWGPWRVGVAAPGR